MTKHISTPMEINIVDLKVMMKVKKIAIVHINLAHKLLWIPLIITALFFGSTQIFLLLLTCSMGKMFGVKRNNKTIFERRKQCCYVSYQSFEGFNNVCCC